jgi:pimeloyl-ACP methyl ester carboxylesterase
MPMPVALILVTGLEFKLFGIVPDESRQDSARLEAQLLSQFPLLQTRLLTWKDDLDLRTVQTPRLMLVGHSFGGDRCLTWIGRSPARIVDRLMLLDPVPDDSHRDRRIDPDYDFPIPANVKRAVCYRRTRMRELPPFSKSIVCDDPSRVEIPLDEWHGGFYRNKTVADEICAQVRGLTN